MSKKQREEEAGGLVFSTNRDYFAEQLKASILKSETLPMDKQKLRVKRDTVKRKGKVVTLVSDFEGTSTDLESLAKRLKQACGTGGSAKDGEIIIQGDVVDKVLSLLIEWGYKQTKRQ